MWHLKNASVILLLNTDLKVVLFGLFGSMSCSFSNSREEKDVRSSFLDNIQKLNLFIVIVFINVLLARAF